MFKSIVLALAFLVFASISPVYAVDSKSENPLIPVTVNTAGERWKHIVAPGEGYVMFNMNDAENRQNAFVVAGVRKVFTNVLGAHPTIESWVLATRVPGYLKYYAGGNGVYQTSDPTVESVTIDDLNWRVFHYKVYIRGNARSVSFFLADAGPVVLQGWVNSGSAFSDLKEGKVVQQFLAGIKLGPIASQ